MRFTPVHPPLTSTDDPVRLRGGSYVGRRGPSGIHVRRPDGTPLPNVVPAPPGPFWWGDDSEAAHALARSLLCDALDWIPSEAVVEAFRKDVVERINQDHLVLPLRTIVAWAARLAGTESAA